MIQLLDQGIQYTESFMDLQPLYITLSRGSATPDWTKDRSHRPIPNPLFRLQRVQPHRKPARQIPTPDGLHRAADTLLLERQTYPRARRAIQAGRCPVWLSLPSPNRS